MSIQANLNQLLATGAIGAGLYAQTPGAKRKQDISFLEQEIETQKRTEKEVSDPASLFQIRNLKNEYAAATKRYDEAKAMPQDSPDRDVAIGEAEQTIREIEENPLFQHYGHIEEEDLPYSQRVVDSLRRQAESRQRLFELDPTQERLQAAMEAEAAYRERFKRGSHRQKDKEIPMQNWETPVTELEKNINQRTEQEAALEQRKKMLRERKESREFMQNLVRGNQIFSGIVYESENPPMVEEVYYEED